ncbi:MAG: ComEC/Rec2 family competence protein, partial [Candidatus Brocadiales bacterium]|nr:ComEC/Rec2 family competence protein [Candidatus Brocadiales bacterium]
MQRPIVFITLLFICGIYLGSLTEIPIYLILGICLLLWVICFVCLYVYQCKQFILPCLSIFLVAVSITYYDCRTNSTPGNHIEHILTTNKSLQRISGIIISPPIILDENILNKKLLQTKAGQVSGKSDYKISFTIRAEEIKTASGWKNISGAIKVNLYPSKQDILNTNDIFTILNKLIYGQRVELFGYAFLPKFPTNPCEFDYKSYLQRQMPSVRCLMTVVNTNNVKTRKSYYSNRVYRFVYALNNMLNNTIYAHTFSNSAPLISSMLLG